MIGLSIIYMNYAVTVQFIVPTNSIKYFYVNENKNNIFCRGGKTVLNIMLMFYFYNTINYN